MSESVEQAALARTPVTDPRVVSALESLGRILEADRRMDELVQERFELLHCEIDRLDAENAELRDGLLALSNRIEAVTRERHPFGRHSFIGTEDTSCCQYRNGDGELCLEPWYHERHA